MNPTNPSDWSCPACRADWDAEWEFEQLRELATRFIESTTLNHSAELEILDEGYMRVAFYGNQVCLGVVYVTRATAKQSGTALYGVHVGADDLETHTTSIDEVIDTILASKGHWDGGE